MLKGEHEVYFGGLVMRASAWLERHLPLVQEVVLRATVTPEVIAASGEM
jgi:hypothetical protein